MNKCVISAIEKYNLLENGDSVVVALSGGADSVALLDVLICLKEKYNLKIFAAHLNHNIRGAEAKRDENFCKNLCKKYNVELFLKNVEIKRLAENQKISEELCGRNERYKFFDELSLKLGAKVATAHTASDNVETLLFNVARGASIKGLGAIPPRRGNIIRPLIEVTRSQIEKYCAENKLNFVTDSTNLTDAYTRNRIRHSVVPELREINFQLERSIQHLSENARELSEFLDKQTEKALEECRMNFGYKTESLLNLDKAVMKNALVMICRKQADFSPEYRHIDLMLEILKNGGAVNLSDNLRAVSKQGIFRLDFAKNKTNNFYEILTDNSDFEFNGRNFKVSKINSDKKNKNSVSADFMNKAEFRTRKAGDKFTYPKRNVTKPLRRVLGEMKIPSEIRDEILVLSIDNIVLWCENIGVSAEGKNNSDEELFIDIF